MKTLVIIILLLTAVMTANVLEAQKPVIEVNNNSSETEAIQQEVGRLRIEIDRLRKERDTYRADLDRGESHVSASLKVLSAQLSKEIRDDFYGSASRLLWIVGILIGVATAGGFWKLSDVITARVNEKVDQEKRAIQRLSEQLFDDLTRLKVNVAEKEKELERLGEQMRDALAAFSKQAEQHRRKVERVSEQVVAEMQTRVLEASPVVDASGKQSTVLTQAEPARAKKWGAAGLPPSVTRVFPAGPKQYAAESRISGKYYGNFAYYFSKALVDPVADSDGDGRVSLREAVLAAKKSLKAAGFDQDPDIVGPGDSAALFSLHKIPGDERPIGKVLAVLVGINEYSGSIPSLQGAVNDVLRFQKLLEDRSRILASEVICHVLTDKEATRSHIEQEIEWLRSSSSSNDLVLFLFSGHGTNVPDPKRKKMRHILVPHDAGENLENIIAETDLLAQLNSISSNATVYITG